MSDSQNKDKEKRSEAPDDFGATLFTGAVLALAAYGLVKFISSVSDSEPRRLAANNQEADIISRLAREDWL